MMQRSRRTVVAVCAAGALGIGGLAWWNATRPTPENDPVGYSVATAQRAIRLLPTIPIGDSQGISDGLSSVPIGAMNQLPVDESSVMIDDLREYAVALIQARFCEPGPDAYIDVQRRRGRRFLTADEFPTDPGASLDAIASYWLGEHAAPNTTPETLFRAVWSVSLDVARGSNRATGAATSGGGMAVAFGRLEHPDMPHTERLSGDLGAETWYGSISHTCGRWMAPPNSKATLIERYGPLPSASVGIVLEFAAGPRRPVVLLFFWDPDIRSWQLDAVTVNNYDPPDGVNPCPVF